MKVRMRATGSYLFHDKIVRSGDIIEGTTSEYEWLRGADCAVKICEVENRIEDAMIEPRAVAENRKAGRPRRNV